MSLYATLDGIQNELKSSASGNFAITAAEQNQLLFYARVASKRFDQLLGFEFQPRIETRDFLLTSDKINSTLKTFYFGQPLLSLSGVVVGSTTLTVATEVTTWPNNPVEPVRHLRLLSGSAVRSWYGFSDDEGDPLVVSITGIWGYRTRYANEAWLKYDDVLNTSEINASVTSITVADADGTDPFGLTPRFSRGQFIRIGTEYMEVTAVNANTNVLTVRRGMNGSTAAIHAQNDDVDSWQTEEEVRRVVERQAAMMQSRKGAFQAAEASDVGTIIFPSDLLAELMAVATLYSHV